MAHLPTQITPNRAETTSVSRWLDTCRERPLVYRAVVAAPESLAAIRNLGGWIFDTTAAGWQVAVLVPDHEHQKSLHILGAAILDLDQALTTGIHRLKADRLLIAADLFHSDQRTRDAITDSPQHRTATTLWGPELPTELNGLAGVNTYQPSSAARAFKTVAINTAGHLDEIATATEPMWTARIRTADHALRRAATALADQPPRRSAPAE